MTAAAPECVKLSVGRPNCADWSTICLKIELARASSLTMRGIPLSGNKFAIALLDRVQLDLRELPFF